MLQVLSVDIVNYIVVETNRPIIKDLECICLFMSGDNFGSTETEPKLAGRKLT